MSPRASKVLGAVGVIAAEDTRRTGALLKHLGLQAKLVSLHEHNEAAQNSKLLTELAGGRDVALVSDAGTPLISDPGLKLVTGAAQAGIEVVAVPGPSAVTAALSVAGLPTDRFVFEGFLPRRASKRRARLADLADEPRTLVFFEAVHRLRAALTDLSEAFGAGRPAAIARELTKLHEQVLRAPLGELAALPDEALPLLGEFVIVVAGAPRPAGADAGEVRRVFALLAEALPPTEAVALCARITGCPRNEVYELTRT